MNNVSATTYQNLEDIYSWMSELLHNEHSHVNWRFEKKWTAIEITRKIVKFYNVNYNREFHSDNVITLKNCKCNFGRKLNKVHHCEISLKIVQGQARYALMNFKFDDVILKFCFF